MSLRDLIDELGAIACFVVVAMLIYGAAQLFI